MTEIEEIPLLIEKAVKLHGHLGPFLVIGVRMGNAAKSHLDVDDNSGRGLQASVETPLYTPFSCVIDGIQASTSCTVGNQRLKIENSAKEIKARFTLQGTNRAVKILVSPKVVKDLINELSEGVNPEQLAIKIAHMRAEQLFVLKKNVGLDMEDLRIAKNRLAEKGLTLSIVKGKQILFETSSHGISGFLKAIEELGMRLNRASVADKIVGKAVALLCLGAGIDAVYASVMSTEATGLFEKNAVYAEWNELVEDILGSCKSTKCPFERLATKITDPAEAYKKIKALQDSLETAP